MMDINLDKLKTLHDNLLRDFSTMQLRINSRKKLNWDFTGINHVLIFDDSPDDLILYKREQIFNKCFAQFDFQVELHYKSKIDTLDNLSNDRSINNKLIIAFLDYHLNNGETAKDVLRKVDTQGIVIITGQLNAEVKAMAMERGLPFIEKPLTVEKLDKVLRIIFKDHLQSNNPVLA
jgi:FixJ family two-component response regulator